MIFLFTVRAWRLWAFGASVFLFSCLSAKAVWQVGENYWPFWVNLEEEGPSGPQRRDQFLGPFVEEYTSPEQDWTAVRPFGIRYTENAPLNPRSLYIFYPFYSYRATDPGYYWNLFYLIRGSRYQTNGEMDSSTFEIFPFYFDYDYPHTPAFSYWGILPFYGEIKDRFFFDRVKWVLFPFYTEWENNGETSYGTPWPFIFHRRGAGSSGFAFWPFFGTYKRPGHYSYKYLLWPLIYHQVKNLGAEEPTVNYGFLPFYTYEKRPNMVQENFFWPFFGYTDQQEPDYHETRYFWPFLVQGRGTPYVNRWGPFYTRSIRNGVDKQWWMWPLLKRRTWQTEQLNVSNWSFLYFLYWAEFQTARDPNVDFSASKTYAWPWFSMGNNGQGRKQFQLFTPFQPWFKHNEVIRDVYSPLFAIYRYDGNSELDTWRHSFVFNLVTVEKKEVGHRFTLGPILDVRTGEEEGGFSILHGLFGRKRVGDETDWKLFWFTL
ncbi:hypothetical protein [Puniceicoccus vermicola]|uniref:Uncharacterized protein n=1 Tax=Puniceicoccus vermicola TaxID=388746 RepID=A0A7X1AYC3_9BACT|nr:hypothetical protein [Puniceicoccus vermicola]MBC2602034.1 hypothetical protein [Puniceicoccus vermicola]